MPDYRQNDLPFQRQQSYIAPQMSSIEAAENEKRMQRAAQIVANTAPTVVLVPLSADSPTLTDVVEHGAKDPNVAPMLVQDAGLSTPDNYNSLNQARVNMIFAPAPAGMPLGNQAYMYPNGIIGGIPHAPANAAIGKYMDMLYPNGLMGGVVEPWVYFGNPAGPIQSAVGDAVVNAQIAEGAEYGTKAKPVVPVTPPVQTVDMGGTVMSIGVDSDGTLNVTTTAPDKNEIFPIADNPSSSGVVNRKMVNRSGGNGAYRAMM